MSTVRDTATLTVVGDPVSGLKKARGKDRQPRQRLDRHVVPEDRIMKAVRGTRRPGEKLRVVSETEVWLVPDVK